MAKTLPSRAGRSRGMTGPEARWVSSLARDRSLLAKTSVAQPARDTCRHYGCPLLCTPRARDGRPLSAGLLAHGSVAAGAFPVHWTSGWVPASSPLTVAGAATDWQRRVDRRVADRVPFSPRNPREARNQQAEQSSPMAGTESSQARTSHRRVLGRIWNATGRGGIGSGPRDGCRGGFRICKVAREKYGIR